MSVKTKDFEVHWSSRWLARVMNALGIWLIFISLQHMGIIVTYTPLDIFILYLAIPLVSASGRHLEKSFRQSERKADERYFGKRTNGEDESEDESEDGQDE